MRTDNVTEWLAARGGGNPPYYGPSIEEIDASLRAEFQQISRISTAALAYVGKFEPEVAQHLAELVPARSKTPHSNRGVNGWLPYGGAPLHGGDLIPPSQNWKRFSVLVTDTSGTKHLVEYQDFSALAFAEMAYAVGHLATVQRMDIRYIDWSEPWYPIGWGRPPMKDLWGHIVGVRHPNVASIIQRLTASAIVPPAIVTPAIVPPAIVPPAIVTPAIVPPAIVPPAIVTPAIVPPAIVTPAIVTPAIVTPAIVTPAIVPPAVVPSAPAGPIAPVAGASTGTLIALGVGAAVLIGLFLLARRREG